MVVFTPLVQPDFRLGLVNSDSHAVAWSGVMRFELVVISVTNPIKHRRLPLATNTSTRVPLIDISQL